MCIPSLVQIGQSTPLIVLEFGNNMACIPTTNDIKCIRCLSRWVTPNSTENRIKIEIQSVKILIVNQKNTYTGESFLIRKRLLMRCLTWSGFLGTVGSLFWTQKDNPRSYVSTCASGIWLTMREQKDNQAHRTILLSSCQVIQLRFCWYCYWNIQWWTLCHDNFQVHKLPGENVLSLQL